MTLGAVIAVVLILMLALLLLRVPVAVSLGVAGAIGLLLLRGFNHHTGTGDRPFSQTATFSDHYSHVHPHGHVCGASPWRNTSSKLPTVP